MIKKRHLFTIVAISANLWAFVFAPATHAISTSSFDPTRIIDDGVFYNSSSMTVDQIQAFLNSKVPTCDTWGTQYYGSVTRASYGTAHGFPPPYTCLKSYYENPSTQENNLNGNPIPAGGQSAAQIISTAASYYGINPQVLIVLLQKEQALVTDDWPAPYEYNMATGYGCPDSTGCNSSFYGFYSQVNLAARQFRYYASYPNSYNYVPGPGNYVQYNPTASCGGTYLDIQNQATASLYDYTPYQPNAAALAAGYGTGDSCSAYGNRNFWLYFNDWFGSTLFPQPVGGSLLYQTSTGNIYLTTDTTRYYIPSWSMLKNYGLDAYPSQPASDATIQQYTDGGTLTNLVYNSNGVFLVNNQVLYHVSPDMCTAWALSCYDNTVVKTLGSDFQTEYLKGGTDLPPLAASNGVIYQMSNGEKQPIANPATLSALGFSTTPILVTSSLNSTYPLGTLLLTTPGLVQFSSSSPLYYFDGSAYYQVPDMNTYNDWALSNVPALQVPTSSYTTTAPASTPLSSYTTVNGIKYVIDQGRSLSVPSSLGTLWPDTQFTATPTALFNSLPTQTLSQNIYSSIGVYVLASGQKHYVSSVDDFSGLGITPNNLTNLRADKLAPISTGTDALPDGKLALTSNDGKIYVVNNHKLTYIPSPSLFNIYGYDWGKIFSYSSNITTDYPIDTNSLGYMVNSAGDAFLPGNNTLYKLPASFTADFGIISSSLSPITNQAIKATNIPNLPRFLYNTDNGKIYYASGGAIHYVTGNASYVAYGGLTVKPAAVNSAFIALFVMGQDI